MVHLHDSHDMPKLQCLSEISTDYAREQTQKRCWRWIYQGGQQRSCFCLGRKKKRCQILRCTQAIFAISRHMGLVMQTDVCSGIQQCCAETPSLPAGGDHCTDRSGWPELNVGPVPKLGSSADGCGAGAGLKPNLQWRCSFFASTAIQVSMTMLLSTTLSLFPSHQAYIEVDKCVQVRRTYM